MERIYSKLNIFITLSIIIIIITARILYVHYYKGNIDTPNGILKTSINLDNIKYSYKEYKYSIYDSKKKYSLISIWASWCNTCIDDLNLLNKIQNNSKLDLLGVNIDDSINTMNNILKNQNITFKNTYDFNHIILNKIYSIIPYNGIPITLIVDNDSKKIISIILLALDKSINYIKKL